MKASPIVVLDACVLANFSLCDTLLRLAEPPRLYEPKWSEQIILETARTLESKLGWPPPLVASFLTELKTHFDDAWISGYESLVPQMTNHEKDRHVAAAAVCAGAQVIITLNVRHFRREHLDPFGIRALHPQSFLNEMFHQEQSIVTAKLQQQASDRRRSLKGLLDILNSTVPDFVEVVAATIR